SPGEAVAAAIHLADAFARPSQSIDPMQVGRALRELVKRLDLLGLVHVLKAPPAPAMPAPSSWKHWPAGRVSHSVRVGTLPIGPVGTVPSWTSPALSTGPGLAKDHQTQLRRHLLHRGDDPRDVLRGRCGGGGGFALACARPDGSTTAGGGTG